MANTRTTSTSSNDLPNNCSKKETFRERQETELEVIRSIYETQVEDLRPKEGKWRPLEVRLRLTPQKGSAREAYVRTDLRVSCNKNYPKYPPKIELENTVGLSDALVKDLLEQLKAQADELKGEVMIYELAGTVEGFLHKHNAPPKGSFYDEMLANQQKRAMDLQNTLKAEEDQRRQVVQDELQKRKKELERTRRESKHSINETSPLHRNTSSSDNSEGNQFRGLSNFCLDHRRSETLFFKDGRKIVKGCCLGHSQRGCIAYSGIDIQTGQLVYITEWSIDLDEDGQTINGKSSEEVVSEIEKQVACLSTIKHKNLISYEGVLCKVGKDGIDIYVIQDFILGTSLFTISGSLGWSVEGASMVAKGILEALIHLHNNGVSHDNLSDSTVFMDNSGYIRVADFKLIPYIQEMINGQPCVRSDLPALGSLVESFFNAHSEMKDFIDRCKSERTISASDLLSHPFLRPILLQDIHKENHRTVNREVKPPEQQPTERSVHSIPAYMNTSLTTEKSRLQTEFEVQSFVGKGAYGDVLKVRNILDNRQYAIKRILLPARSKQFYKKMTREVELLSRLNHENVVRYYNSWVEAVSPSDAEVPGAEGSGDEWSVSVDSIPRKVPSSAAKVVKKNLDKNSDWVLDCMPIDSSSDEDDDDDEDEDEDNDEDFSDGIEFVDSNGEVATYGEFSEGTNGGELEDKKVRNGAASAAGHPEMLYMYIQMEFCEKSTLRTAIDSDLYQDVDRVWRLFREIAEGLSHIHQQGMIHRDLKPANVFLDSRDQVKIGDFGLATTSILALQNQQHERLAHSHQSKSLDAGHSMTGKVGTALYVAPELTGNASKSTYNQKVDLFSLGIVLFEMSFPPLSTGMERVKTLMDLRSESVIFPESILGDNKYSQQVQVIRWLLNHDPSKRPTAEELLSSEIVPPTRLEAGEIQDVVRHVLSNPQSRHYKHLIARCFGQESDAISELSYHLDMVPIMPRFDYIKSKIVTLFRRHGAIEVVTPLLTPYTKSMARGNTVKLMTHSGSIVSLPDDLRIPFIRHVALNGIKFIRRYSIGRVYREKKVFNFHPKQVYECAFDIVTPIRGNLIVDAELLSIANEIMRELNLLDPERNLFFRINHISLLRSILLYCNVPTDKYKELFEIVLDFLDEKISKFQLVASINNQIQQPGMKINSTYLCDALQVDVPLTQINGTLLKSLIKGKGEAAMLAKVAIRELETVVSLAQGMGVQCPMTVCPGLPLNYESAKNGGIVWQLLGELKAKKKNPVTTIAVGGRYDAKLAEFQKSGVTNGLQVPKVELTGAGLSFHLDKLIHAITPCAGCEPVEVLICITGSRPPLKEVVQILRSLWSNGIKTGIHEGGLSFEDSAKEIGANLVVIVGEGGELRVRTWNHDRFQERHVTRPELISYILKILRPEASISEATIALQNTSLTSVASTKSIPSLLNQSQSNKTGASSNLIFLTAEKINTNKRRRYENQVEHRLSPILAKFQRKETISLIMVDLPNAPLRGLIGVIDPTELVNGPDQNSASTLELKALIEKYPKYKKNIKEIYDEVIDIFSESKEIPVVGVYSVVDSFCRLIL
ncbi:eIF-2-alpha kinase GCN2 [Uranotaenia lowii]|uniref:eIF-2-alpha kinase GCN2 n=1 Tax=Uranotaenia lowii TaxID=190385 RepID=UPI0024789006|nr:eIF-2-alpha kinase GCN2 [Uranotaenia lowii]